MRAAMMGFAFAALVIAVVALIGFANMGARDVSISFEAGSAYNATVSGNKAILYNNRGARCINAYGKEIWNIDAALSEPMAELGGGYLLLADLAGNHFAASYKRGKMVREYKIGSDIISAKITAKGCAVFATDTDGYKGRVTVFNKRGRELYVWNSGSGYITDVAITDDGRYLVVAQLISDGIEADTRLQFIDTRRGVVVRSVDRSGEVAVNLKFINPNKLIAVTDNHITAYGKSGREIFSVSLEGKSPSLYSIGDKMIAVAAVDSRGNSVIEMYSPYGNAYGTYTADGDIRALSVGGRSVIAAEQKGVVRIGRSGREKSTMPIGHDIKSIGYFSGDGRAVVIGTSQAETIRIK